MVYTTIKRFKRDGIGGHFNIPYGTSIERREDGILYYNNSPVCVARSFASHEHFCRNDDGNGEIRGKLSHAIINKLGGFHREATPEWEAVWNDDLCQKYKKDQQDYWLWNDDFFNAPLSDLQYIASLVDVNIKKGD